MSGGSEGMKIGLSGSTGFVGRHVLSAFLDHGIAPIQLLRNPPKSKIPSKTERFILHDLDDSTDGIYEKLGSPDIIVHLAWGGLPNYDSLHHFEVDLPRSYRFLKEMISAGTKTIVVAGTCFEYGLKEGRLTESTPVDPGNAYGYAKDSLRRQLEHLKKTYQFNLVWLRLFYLYGPGQPDRSLLSQLEAAINRGDDQFPMTTGEQMRDYLEIRRAAKLIYRLSTLEADLGVVNLCSGRPISVRRLVEEKILSMGSSIKPRFGAVPLSVHEPMAFWGDVEKLRSLIGNDC